MQKIVPCLWFDTRAEEAMHFYTALFAGAPAGAGRSKIVSIKRYPDEVPQEFMKGMEGKVLTGIFELAGYRFMALDGGPMFTFTPAISFFVVCHSADEVDRYWSGLSAGGTALMPLGTYPFAEKYGWVQDQFGLSWQIILAGSDAAEPIVPSLLFPGAQAGQAEPALTFYTQVFDDASVVSVARYGAGQEPDREGTVAYADFRLEGQLFAALDSAHQHGFTFNEAVSFVVECDTQAEVDSLWAALSAVPEAEQCGWLKDKFGVSWQIIPTRLGELLEADTSGRVMDAMLAMKKIDVAGLEAAYAQPV